MKILIALLILPLLLTGSALGQKKKAKPNHLRVIALGERPPFKWKLKNGIRVMDPFEKEEAPPAEFSFARKDLDPLVANLGFINLSKSIPLPPKKKSLDIYRGKTAEGKSWMKLPIKAKLTHQLAVIFPAHKEMNWEKSLSMVVPDDLEALPLQHVRFTNVSHKDVYVMVADRKTIIIKPGRTKVVPLPEPDRLTKFGYLDAQGNADFFFENSLKRPKNQRLHCLFWKRKTKKEVGHTLIYEGAPK